MRKDIKGENKSLLIVKIIHAVLFRKRQNRGIRVYHIYPVYFMPRIAFPLLKELTKDILHVSHSFKIITC